MLGLGIGSAKVFGPFGPPGAGAQVTSFSAVGLSGSVTCTPTVGNEYGSNTAAVTLGATATQVATQSLAAGSSYLAMAYPHVVISGLSGQHVDVALYWQHWSLRTPALELVSEAVRTAAAEHLR